MLDMKLNWKQNKLL